MSRKMVITHYLKSLRRLNEANKRRRRQSRQNIHIEPLEVRCLLSATIQGRVWSDSDSDGRKDTNEEYLNDVEIEAVNADGDVTATTVTRSFDRNDDGEIDPATEKGWYSLESLNSGSHLIRLAGVGPAGQSHPKLKYYQEAGLFAPGYALEIGPGNIVTRKDFGRLPPAITTYENKISIYESESESESGIASVVLNAKPTADVILGIVSDRDDELTFAPDSLTFTPLNWQQPQDIVVTPVDDVIFDADQTTVLKISVRNTQDDTLFATATSRTIAVTTANDEARIQGQIWDDLNRNGEHNEGEPYLNGGSVELVNIDGEVQATAVAAPIDINNDGEIDPETENGVYSFGDLAPGSYQVRQQGFVLNDEGIAEETAAIRLPNGALRDSSYDEERGLLYIVTNAGTLERLHVSSGTFLPSIAVGQKPGSVDITPDGATLFIGEASPKQSHGVIYRIDLNSLAEGSESFHQLIVEEKTRTPVRDFAVRDDGKVLFVAGNYGAYQLREFAPATETTITLQTGQISAKITRNADHSIVRFTSDSKTEIQAISHDGNIVAVNHKRGPLALEDSSGKLIEILSPNRMSSATFDHHGELLYSIDDNEIVAFDVTDFREALRIPYKYRLRGRSSRITIAQNGAQLIVTQPGYETISTLDLRSIDKSQIRPTVPMRSVEARFGATIDGMDIGFTFLSVGTPDPSSEFQVPENGPSAPFEVSLDVAPIADVSVDIATSPDARLSVTPTTLDFTPDNWHIPQSIIVTGIDDEQSNPGTHTDISVTVDAANDSRFPATIDRKIIANILDDEASIQGRIWQDANSDGKHNTDEAFLNDLQVELVTLNGKVVRTATTHNIDHDEDGLISPDSESGWYSFADLKAGDYLIRQTAISEERQSFPLTQRIDAAAPISDTNRRIYDPVFDIEYLINPDGLIERLHVSSQSLLPSLQSHGALLSGGDISLDGRHLYVIEDLTSTGRTQRVRSIDTHTGISTPLTIPTDETISQLKVVSNNTAVLETKPIRTPQDKTITVVDLDTGQPTEIPPLKVISSELLELTRIADTLLIRTYQTAHLYDNRSGTFTNIEKLDDVSEIVVARNGGVVATRTRSDTSIQLRNGDLEIIGTLPGHDGALTVSDTGTTVQVADHDANELYTYDAETLQEISRLPLDRPTPPFFSSPHVVSVAAGQNIENIDFGLHSSITPLASVGTGDSSNNTTDVNYSLNYRPTGNVELKLSLQTDVFSLSHSVLTFTPETWFIPQTITVSRKDNFTGIGETYAIETATVSATLADDNDDLDSNPQFELSVPVPNSQTSMIGRVLSRTGTNPSGAAIYDFVNNWMIRLLDGDGQEIITHTKTIDRNADGVLDAETEAGWYVFSGLDPGRYKLFTSPRSDYGQSTHIKENVIYQHRDIILKENWLTVSETGTTQIWPVSLSHQPNSNVTIQVAADRDDELHVAPRTLTFTPDNWNVVQDVTFTGLDDSKIDEAQQTVIRLTATASHLEDAQSFPDEIVVVTTTNDEISVRGRVFLAQPTETFNGTQIYSNPANNQTVRLVNTATNKVLETQTGTIGSAEDGWYQFDHLAAGSYVVSLPNIANASLLPPTFDADSNIPAAQLAERHLTLTAGTIIHDVDFRHNLTRFSSQLSSSGAIDEAGGTSSIDVRLNSKPDSDVIIVALPEFPNVLASDASELTFTPDNWAIPQTLTVTSIDNDSTPWLPNANKFGPRPEQKLTLSVDASRSDQAFVAMEDRIHHFRINEDDFEIQGRVWLGSNSYSKTSDRYLNDSQVHLLDLDGTLIATTTTASREYEKPVYSDTFFVAYEIQTPSLPTTEIVTENGWFSFPDVEAGKYFLATSTDRKRIRIGLPATGQQTDLSYKTTTIAAQRISRSVSESGRSNGFKLLATFKPQKQVVYNIVSNDPDEAIAEPSSVTFTPDVWDLKKTITISGVDDILVDDTQRTTLTISVDKTMSDPEFHNLPDQIVTVYIQDDDETELVVEADDTQLWEWGGAKPLRVSLSKQPVLPVHVDVREEADGDLTVSTGSILFTSENWNVPQTTYVSASRDGFADGVKSSNVVVSVTDLDSPENFHDVVPRTIVFQSADTDEIRIRAPDLANTRTPAMKWIAHPHAVSYDVELQHVGTESLVLQKRAVPESSVIPDAPLGIGRYRLWVRGNLSDGTQTGWNARAFTVTIALEISDVDIDKDGTFATFSWPSVDGAIGYDVYVRNRTINDAGFITESVESTTFTIPNTALGTYDSWVRPIAPGNRPGKWSPRKRIAVTPIAITPVESVESGSVTFSWTAIPNASTYRLYVTRANGTHIDIKDITSTSYSLDLELGEHHWWIQATSQDGVTAPWSPSEKFNVGVGTQVQSELAFSSSHLAQLEWTSIPDADSYELYARSVSGNNRFHIRNLKTTSYPPVEFPTGDYDVSIRSVGSDGNGVWGQSVRVNVPPPNFSGTVTLIDAFPIDAKRPLLSWTPVDQATTYDVFLRSEFNDENGQRPHHLIQSVTGTSFKISHLLAAGHWSWWIRARGPGNTIGSWSEAGNIYPGVRTRILEASSGPRRIELSWEEVPFAESYSIWLHGLWYHTVITRSGFNGSSAIVLDIGDSQRFRVSVGVVTAGNDTPRWSHPVDVN